VVAAVDRVKRRALLAGVAMGTVGAVALRGWTTKDRQIPPDRQDPVRPAQLPAQPAQPVEPLERRAGYREHKRACLDLGVGEDRREARARSCRAWQEMLAQERQRLAREETASARPVASAPEPR
jgi:hypothetical protein